MVLPLDQEVGRDRQEDIDQEVVVETDQDPVYDQEADQGMLSKISAVIN